MTELLAILGDITATDVALSAVGDHVTGTRGLESIVFLYFDRENLDTYASPEGST